MAKQVTWRWNGKAIPEEGRFDVDDDMPIAEISGARRNEPRSGR